jgi:4-aminobutyrate aminotransferase-like enzyme
LADNIAEELVLACLKEGLLVNPVKPNALRFMPPLIITEKDIDEALGIVETVLAGRL